MVRIEIFGILYIFITWLVGRNSFAHGFSFKYSPSKWNQTHLVELQFLMCGFDYICNAKSVQVRGYRPTLPYRNNTKHCPECFCDDKCLSRGDCCPDIFFGLPELTCANTTVLNYTNSYYRKMKHSDHFHMLIDSCPPWTDQNSSQLCTDPYTTTQLLTRPVVTSSGFPLTYRNKHCAYCNGETVDSTWNLDIDCVFFADFNFLSSYQEIIDQASQSNCRMLFKPSVSTTAQPCTPNKPSKEWQIGTCNTTGRWRELDKDIQYACETSTYEVPYRSYKNVFCYMCNPPVHLPSNLTDTCNTTSLWRPYDTGLKRSCSIYPRTSHMFPFKNVFCFLCNRINLNSVMYIDSVSNIHESFLTNQAVDGAKTSPMLTGYFVTISSIRYEYFRSIYSPYVNQSVVYSREDMNRYPIDGRLVNITNLAYKHFATAPYDTFCRKTLVPLQYILSYAKPCLCDPNCLFTKSKFPCCLDFALTYPTTCTSNTLSTNPDINMTQYQRTDYLVTSGCDIKEVNPVFKRRCEQSEPSDLLTYLPIININTNVPYKNMDCSMCNMKVQDIEHVFKILENLEQFKPMDVMIRCTDILETGHYVLTYDVLRLAKYMGCEMILKPNLAIVGSVTKCKYSDNVITTCNATGNWPRNDSDVHWACENRAENMLPTLNEYKNMYCYLCNPILPVVDVISACNVTGKWTKYSPTVDQACTLFPRIYSILRYKNIFCELCNEDYISLSASQGRDTDEAGGWEDDSKPKVHYITTYRRLFSVASYDDSSSKAANQTCSDSQIFDATKGICRNITCFPGKVFNNGSCIPLLTVTTNLRYILSMELTGDVSEVLKKESPLRVIHSLSSFLKMSIQQRLSVHNMTTDSLHLLSNLPCDRRPFTNKIDGKFLFHFTFFVEEYVDRYSAETSLMSLATEVFTIRFDSVELLLKARPSLEAFNTPALIQKADFHDTCYVQLFRNRYFIPYENYRSMHASKVLLCKQLELEKHEYDLDILKMEIKIKSINKLLHYDRYQMMSKGKTRVCLEDVEELSVEQEILSNIEIALGYVTYVCTIVSLTCLLITFITYCICPKLQTVPGINNMFLIFSLFLAQSMFVFGIHLKDAGQVVCSVNGILLHFFWLTSFTCMNVCSFHMFRAFSGIVSIMQSPTKKLKLVINYAYYSIGLPTLTVAITICITLGTSQGADMGYGDGKCFITNKIVFIVTFLVPILVICFTNILFFTITAYSIRNTPKINSNIHDRRQFDIYLKLFILTGVTWVFVVVESFFPLSVFSFITTVLNGCQGVYIFISYVCNKRTIDMLKHNASRKYLEGVVDRIRRFSRHTSMTYTTGSSITAVKKTPSTIEEVQFVKHANNIS